MTELPDAPMRRFTDDEIERYRRDGVIMARGLMAPEWFERIEKSVAAVMRAPTPIAAVFSAPEQGFHMEAGLFVSDEGIRDVVYRSPMATLAQQLMGSKKVHFFYDQMFSKQPGNQTPTPWHHDLTGSVLLIVGGEVDGIPKPVLAHCDAVTRLPMAGFVASYNLQAAVAAVAVERFRQLEHRADREQRAETA